MPPKRNSIAGCRVAATALLAALFGGCDRDGTDFSLNRAPAFPSVSVLVALHAFGTQDVHLYMSRQSAEGFLGSPSSTGPGWYGYRKDGADYRIYYDPEFIVTRLEIKADPMLSGRPERMGKTLDVAVGEFQAQLQAKLGAPTRDEFPVWFYDSLFTGFIFSHPGKRIIGITYYASPDNPYHMDNSGRTILAMEGRGTSDIALLSNRSRVDSVLGPPDDSTDFDFIYRTGPHVYFIEYGDFGKVSNIILLSQSMVAASGPSLDDATGIAFGSTRAEVLRVYGAPDERTSDPESWFYFSRGIGFIFSTTTEVVFGAWIFPREVP